MRIRTVATLLSLLLLGAVACGGQDTAGGEPVACDDPTATTTPEMFDFGYAPACVEAEAGATLTVTNSGKAPHTFTVQDGPSADIAAGASADLALEGVAPGTYSVTCVYHPQMTAALRVT
jgi:plastocyanin